MTMSTRARVRSALAILATVALATVGLVSPASAAGTGTIRGTVVAPAGLERAGEIDLFSWSPQLERWTYQTYTTITPGGTSSGLSGAATSGTRAIGWVLSNRSRSVALGRVAAGPRGVGNTLPAPGPTARNVIVSSFASAQPSWPWLKDRLSSDPSRLPSPFAALCLVL